MHTTLPPEIKDAIQAHGEACFRCGESYGEYNKCKKLYDSAGRAYDNLMAAIIAHINKPLPSPGPTQRQRYKEAYACAGFSPKHATQMADDILAEDAQHITKLDAEHSAKLHAAKEGKP